VQIKKWFKFLAGVKAKQAQNKQAGRVRESCYYY
jgi:hypothetical protein